MNIYKNAGQLTFFNTQALEKKIKRFKDLEYSAYISLLSQIHEELIKDEMLEPEDVIEDIAGENFVKPMSVMLKDIGLEVFLNNSFDKITAALDSLRNSGATPIEEIPAPTKEEPVVRPEPVQNEDDYEDAETEEVYVEELSLQEVMNLSRQDRDKYLKSVTTPSLLENKQDVLFRNILLRNINMMEDALASSKSQDVTSKILSDLEDAVSTFLEIKNTSVAELEEKEKLEKERLEEDKSLSLPLAEKLKKEKNDFLRNPFLGVPQKSNASFSAHRDEASFLDNQDLYQNKAFKELMASSQNPYIDFSQTPPVFNEEMDIVSSSLFTQIENMLSEAIGIAMKGGDLSNLKQKLNELIFSAKYSDYITYKELMERKKVAPLELQEVFEKFQHRVENEAPTRRLLSPDYSEKVFFLSILVASPKLGKMVALGDEKILQWEMENNKALTNIDMDTLKNKLYELAWTNYNNKAKEFFNLTSRYREKNFIDRVGQKYEYVLMNALKQILPSTPSVTMKSCPTCFKMVPWSYPKEVIKAHPKYKGFRIRLVSFFTHDKDNPKVTMDVLKSRKWPAPPASLFSEEREQQLVIKYAKDGEKSWDEIQAMISSNNRDKHEEGLHRRTGALYAAGGALIGTSDLLIRDLATECPFGDSSGKSMCGASFNPTSSKLLQPQWNGTVDSGISNVLAPTLVKDLWQDKDAYNTALRKQSSGFKFSKTNFACTCRITNVDSLTSYKHNLFAVSKAGPVGSPGFVYPTKPNGDFDTEIPDNTLSFMVCGAPTSLSSFNKDPNSSSFILSHMKKVKDESLPKYQKLVLYLMKLGVDIEDIMDIDQDLDDYTANLETQSPEKMARINKINNLIKEAVSGMEKDSERRELLSGLSLTCPFGHSFTIGQSLEFGEAYSGIHAARQSKVGGKSFKDYSNLAKSSGNENLSELIKMKILVKSNDPELIDYPNKLYYNEWIKFPNRLVFPETRSGSDRTLPLLKFSFKNPINNETEDYSFLKHSSNFSNNIWSPNSTYLSNKTELKQFERATFINRDTSKDREDDGEEKASKEDIGDYNEWNVSQINDIAQYGDERIPGKVIPGSRELETETGISKEVFDEKIASFSRAIKSSIHLINTWTESIVSDSMINSLFGEYKPNVTAHFDFVARTIFPLLDMQDINGESPSNEDKAKILIDVKKYIIDHLEAKMLKLHDWMRSNVTHYDNEDLDKEVASKVLLAVFQDFNNQDPDIGFYSEHGEAMFKENINIESISEKIINANTALRDELVLKSVSYRKNQQNFIQYTGRIILISYSHYLANALSMIYKKYCQNEDSGLYIGYNIGIDFSSPEKIIGKITDTQVIGGIKREDLSNITSSYSDAIKISGPFKKLKSTSILPYGYRIDRAWEELETYLKNARRQILSARALEISRNFLVSKINLILNVKAAAFPNKKFTNIEELRNEITKKLPNKSLLFSGTVEEPETSNRLVTKRRIPYVSKAINLLQMNGTKQVEEWLVRNKTSTTAKAFSSQQDAQAYLEDFLNKNPNENAQSWIVEPDPYWLNELNGFDSSKNQIGVVIPKVEKTCSWPPAPGDWDFVGINLPFDVLSPKADASMNKAKSVPISSYRFIIDFQGENLDITPLIRKGSDDNDLGEIIMAENAIIKLVRDYQQDIETFKQENAKLIAETPELLSKYTVIEEGNLNFALEPYLKVIDSKSLYISTQSSYIEPQNPSEKRPLLKAVLEDPMRCYKIIMNPKARGISLSSSEQRKLLEFVVKVFNLEQLSDLVKESGKGFDDFTTEELFTRANELKFLGPKIKKTREQVSKDELGWFNKPGEYFNLVPGNIESDEGSYLQYIYDAGFYNSKVSSGKKHPDVTAFINASHSIKVYKMDINENSDNAIVNKIEADMLDYITGVTSGERSNLADDFISTASKERYNKDVSASNLRRTILSWGFFNLEDIELPKM